MTKTVTNAKKTAAAKKPHGGKPGQARASQSAQYAKGELAAPKTKAPKNAADRDAIVTVIPAQGSSAVVASTATRNVVIQPWQLRASVTKLAVTGASMAVLEAHLATLVKPEAKLANGVDSHNAPHAAKAVADAKAAKPTPAAKPAAKGAKDRTVKADKAKQPSKGTNRAYSATKMADTSKPDTFRNYMLATIRGAKDMDGAKAAHAKSKKFSDKKLDFNWAAAQGYISWAK